jgi:hypothetical protein
MKRINPNLKVDGYITYSVYTKSLEIKMNDGHIYEFLEVDQLVCDVFLDEEDRNESLHRIISGYFEYTILDK